MSSKKEIPIDSNSIAPEFRECESIHKANLGNPEDDRLPIYFGYNTKKEEFILQIGEADNAIFMSKLEYAYFMASLAKLSNEGVMESFSSSTEDFITEQLVKGGIKLSYGNSKDPMEDTTTSKPMGKLSSEDLENFLDTTVKKAKLDSSDDPIDTEEYEELKEQLADFEKIYKNLTDEEKAKVEAQMNLRREEMLEEKAKKFEATLLGEIEQEDKIEYTYKYFKQVYDEKGPEFMREELAKIPKAERSAIIKKIVAEVEQEQLNKTM